MIVVTAYWGVLMRFRLMVVALAAVTALAAGPSKAVANLPAPETPLQPAPPEVDAGWTADDIASFQRRAAAGNATSMYSLGYAFEHGDGVEADLVKSAAWYLKAANLGNRDAMNNLGSLYFNGRGVALDYVTALRWFRKAAALGNEIAMFNVAFAYDIGAGVPVDDVEAVRWYRKSAEAGYDDAVLSMGQMYEDGEGVERDREASAYWYELASHSDDPEVSKRAKAGLDRLRALPRLGRTPT